MLNRFISIVDGSDYQGELPITVRIPSSWDINGMTVTEWLVASVGDANYQDVLESYMFEQGYVRKMDNSRPHALVIMKGGAGSGFHGHKGRPGEVGGSLPEGAVAAKRVREAKFLNAENMSDEDKARIRAELTELADRLGFPVDKMAYFNHDAPAFKVGDNNYETAMCYSPKLGEITIYPGSMLIKDGVTHINAPLVAHEVMHHRFYLFEKQLHKQEALINKLGVGLDDNPVLNNDFSLKSEFTEQYWAVDIKHRYYQYGDMRELLYQIPVTDYGKSYIEVARKSIYGVDMSRAIGENLAEVAAYSDNPNVFVSTRWSKLYNEINQSLYTHKLIPKYVPLVRSDNG
jgi:hypothetical protein